MYKVDASTIREYFDWEPDRKPDLLYIDQLIRQFAPNLKRWYYNGSLAGEPGMRMKLIGYGSFEYPVKSGQTVKWPIVGLALQKHYISVYLSVVKNNEPILNAYRNKLGALRYGSNNFSFSDPVQLDLSELTKLFRAIEEVAMKNSNKAFVYNRSKKRD